MNRTKASLKDNKSGWASKFVEAGGISALSQYLTNCTLKPKYVYLSYYYMKLIQLELLRLSARDHSMIRDCLEMFKILLNVSLKSVLTSSGAVGAISLPLSLDDAKNTAFTVELLEDICSNAIHIGAQYDFSSYTFFML